MKQQGNDSSVFSATLNTRRDFIKLCSAAAAGGISSFLLPRYAEAESELKALKALSSQNPFDELFWAFVRLHFILKPGLIYMNTGTEGSMPRLVLSGMREYFKEFAENPWDAMTESDVLSPLMTETRTCVSQFIGADFKEVVLTHSTTEGMCFVANGLDLTEGDEVITTLHEHPGGLCCWQILKERRKVTLTQVELPTPATSKDEIIAAFEAAITPKTRVMSFCHINYTTGLRMPVKELCQLAANHGILTVVDGAHAIGMLNLDLHDLGCDFYATSPHKWLNAPPGTGVLYMREEVQDLVWPTVTESSPFPKGTDVFQGRGQQCTPAFAGLKLATEFQNAIGKDTIQGRILELSEYLKGKIIDCWGEDKLFSPTQEELSSGLVSFNPTDDPYSREVNELYPALRERYNIVIRPVSFKDTSDSQSRRALRVSTHIFNNKSEIDTLISGLTSIMETL